MRVLEDVLPEDLGAHKIFFKLAHKARADRDIQSMIRYFTIENAG
jgi:hypothetical protein